MIINNLYVLYLNAFLKLYTLYTYLQKAYTKSIHVIGIRYKNREKNASICLGINKYIIINGRNVKGDLHFSDIWFL